MELHRMNDRKQTGSATERRRHKLTRMSFQVHLWLGVLFTVVLLSIGVTGIALNHKRGLGLMPDVANTSTQQLDGALPLLRLAEIGLAAGHPGAAIDLMQIERMDVRVKDGFVKVRLRDRLLTEVTIDLMSGKVLHVGPRADVFFEKLHSGELFGERGIFLSDAGAIALIITLITGIWLWIAPRLRRGGRDDAPEAQA
jgi:uncharacterized iron-regulated membrane protein